MDWRGAAVTTGAAVALAERSPYPREESLSSRVRSPYPWEWPLPSREWTPFPLEWRLRTWEQSPYPREESLPSRVRSPFPREWRLPSWEWTPFPLEWRLRTWGESPYPREERLPSRVRSPYPREWWLPSWEWSPYPAVQPPLLPERSPTLVGLPKHPLTGLGFRCRRSLRHGRPPAATAAVEAVGASAHQQAQHLGEEIRSEGPLRREHRLGLETERAPSPLAPRNLFPGSLVIDGGIELSMPRKGVIHDLSDLVFPYLRDRGPHDRSPSGGVGGGARRRASGDPGRQGLRAWLAAFNSADAAQLRAFDAAYPREGTPTPVEDRLRFREMTRRIHRGPHREERASGPRRASSGEGVGHGGPFRPEAGCRRAAEDPDLEARSRSAACGPGDSAPEGSGGVGGAHGPR